MTADPAYLSRASLAAALEIPAHAVDEMVRRGAICKPIIMGGKYERWRAVDAFEAWRAWNRSSVYVIQSGAFVKIGITENLPNRLKSLESSSPHEVTLIASFRDGRQDEIRLHARFGQYAHRGEWFLNEGKLAAWIEAGCKWP